MRLWANFIGYQLVWLAAVYGASQGEAWPALLTTAVFVLIQLTASRQRGADLALIATALVLGLLVDGTLARSHVLRYATPAPAVPAGGAPAWILALWVAFALTINHSLRWLRGRPLVGVVAGVLGGPLAYAGAARLGAVTPDLPLWRTAAYVAVGWGIALALLAAVAGHRAKAAGHSLPAAEPQP
jgi:hypothetical protein